MGEGVWGAAIPAALKLAKSHCTKCGATGRKNLGVCVRQFRLLLLSLQLGFALGTLAAYTSFPLYGFICF